jgi:hypothetical protein
MSSSKIVRESWRIAAVVVAAVALARIAGAQNIAGPSPVVRLDCGPGHGAFLHLKALQEIAVANGGNRAAGTPGYDRSAEYVAERLKEVARAPTLQCSYVACATAFAASARRSALEPRRPWRARAAALLARLQ